MPNQLVAVPPPKPARPADEAGKSLVRLAQGTAPARQVTNIGQFSLSAEQLDALIMILHQLGGNPGTMEELEGLLNVLSTDEKACPKSSTALPTDSSRSEDSAGDTENSSDGESEIKVIGADLDKVSESILDVSQCVSNEDLHMNCEHHGKNSEEAAQKRTRRGRVHVTGPTIGKVIKNSNVQARQIISGGLLYTKLDKCASPTEPGVDANA